MTKKSLSKGIIKDIIIVAIGVLAIWIALQFAFGTENPFYVVSSGSMIPVLEVYDVLVVSGHVPFDEIEVGDIIVFNRPSDHDRVIVHRVAAILEDDPRTLRTKGDANPASISGTDFPITEDEYIGEVAYVIPQIGYITQVLRPPTNYIIIAIVIGIMIYKQMIKKKKEQELSSFESISNSNEVHSEQTDGPDVNQLEKDEIYSKNDSEVTETKSTPETELDKDKSNMEGK